LLIGDFQRGVETERQVLMRRQRLRLDIAVVPDEGAVGEGSADVDRYAAHDAVSGSVPGFQCECGGATNSGPRAGSLSGSRAAHCVFRASMSRSMSWAGGWPGGRYSTS